MGIDLRSHTHPLVFAHRGDSKNYPENTLLSMDSAVQVGADVLETDFCLTKDNQLVLSHDLRVDRLSGVEGYIRDFTLEELQQLDAGYNYTLDGKHYPFRDQGISIPSARELFENFPQMQFNIDLKIPDQIAVTNLLTLVEEFDLESQILVGSFHADQITRIRKLSPNIATGGTFTEARNFVLIAKLYLNHWLPNYPQFHALQLPPSYRGLKIATPRVIDALHRRGCALHIWTINDPVHQLQLIRLGIDGIFTDDPAGLRSLLEHRQDLNPQIN